MSSSGTGRQAINWAQVRQRLARAIAATEGARSLSPEQARAVLEERARLLARTPPVQPRATEIVEVVKFSVAGERYAVGACFVREVVRFTALTPVPGTPPFLAGVVNLRGEILAVFDLPRLFGMDEAREPASILVLGGERPEFGLLADAVHELVALRHDEILSSAETIAAAGRAYLQGMTADALIVLNGAALLQDPRLYIELEEEPA
jgi:purine-binding chemotaxis protein CheW